MPKKLTLNEFIERSRKIHGDRYDYSHIKEYKNNQTKVPIICPEHGEFLQTPKNHLNGRGCPKCGGTEKMTTQEFIEKAKHIHGSRYDYSLVEYDTTKDKVKIICNDCGRIFLQRPQDHLRAYGCPYCWGKNKTTEEFIEEARKVHGDKYDYSEVTYFRAIDKIKIKCRKCGHVFLVTPHDHITHKNGCPYCNSSKLEKKTAKLLDDSGITYTRQQTFPWLKLNKYTPMTLDFFIPELNVAIECQGGQHFKPVDCFGGDENYNSIRERDLLKYNLCVAHGIKVIYYTDVNLPKYPYKVVKDKSLLIQLLLAA